MTHSYKEPRLAVLCLDFAKPIESHLCLQSIKRHVKVPHTVIFCDNGSRDAYSLRFLREGLIDQLIVNRDSRGLGLGTRDLFALTFAEHALYIQNDQIFGADLTEQEFNAMIGWIGGRDSCGRTVKSISLAGAPCGDGVYSERAHIIRTSEYKDWEDRLGLGYHGAGVHHDGIWREEIIQNYYQSCHNIHLRWPNQLVFDNGVFAVRDMKDGGLWCHRTDTKQLWNIVPPTKKNPSYPKLLQEEFDLAAAGKWPDGEIPSMEIKDSFRCWDNSLLAKMQDEYIKDLRERVKESSNESINL